MCGYVVSDFGVSVVPLLWLIDAGGDVKWSKERRVAGFGLLDSVCQAQTTFESVHRTRELPGCPNFPSYVTADTLFRFFILGVPFRRPVVVFGYRSAKEEQAVASADDARCLIFKFYLACPRERQ